MDCFQSDSEETVALNESKATAHFEEFAGRLNALNSPDAEMGKETSILKEILAGVGLTGDDTRIGLTAFRRIIFENLNVDGSFMYKRVFKAVDVDQKGYLTPKQLLSLMMTLLHGPFGALVELALRIYGKPSDANLNTSPKFTISLPDAVECLVESLQLSTPRARHTLTTTTREKAYKVGEDLVLLIFPKLDADKDGFISYNDFLQACEVDDSLIQVFGQFLPKSSFIFGSRPGTPLTKPMTPVERPRSVVKTTFEGIDYLKHSPTLGTMWGREKGPGSGMIYKTSEKLEPIPLIKKDAKLGKKLEKREKGEGEKKKQVRSSAHK